jgi:hypothetical protein
LGAKGTIAPASVLARFSAASGSWSPNASGRLLPAWSGAVIVESLSQGMRLARRDGIGDRWSNGWMQSCRRGERRGIYGSRDHALAACLPSMQSDFDCNTNTEAAGRHGPWRARVRVGFTFHISEFGKSKADVFDESDAVSCFVPIR